jgi:hypothetical protein
MTPEQCFGKQEIVSSTIEKGGRKFRCWEGMKNKDCVVVKYTNRDDKGKLYWKGAVIKYKKKWYFGYKGYDTSFLTVVKLENDDQHIKVSESMFRKQVVARVYDKKMYQEYKDVLLINDI